MATKKISELTAVTTPTGADIFPIVQSSTTLRATRAQNASRGADIASAATTNIGAATGEFVDVTGTTTITAFDTVAVGTRRIVRFTGALTVTHNATTLIMPGAVNITTVANQCMEFISLGSGNWQCTSVNYNPATATAKGVVELATNAEALAGTDTTLALVAGNLLHVIENRAHGFLYIALSGTNTYTGTLSPAPAAYVTNMLYFLVFTNAATTATPTVNLNSLGAINLKDAEGNALLLNDIPAGHRGIAVYDGTNMRLLNLRTPRSGTWTPTATLVANLDACVPAQGQYTRIGNTVVGSVEFTADATAGGTTVTRVRLSIPIASDFGATRDAAGVSNTANSNNEPGVVLADTVNNELEVTWLSSTAANITHRCVFCYNIL